MRDMKEYAENKLSELLDYEVKGFMDADDVTRAVEDLDGEFDGDSYCPYYSQQDEVVRDYEREFGSDAEDISGDETYKASDYQRALTAYAYAIAYAAFNHYFEQAKRELIDGIEEFVSDLESEFPGVDGARIQVAMKSSLGWAAHDRELSDGTMIFESRQLDGANGMERCIAGVWVSSVFDAVEESDDESEAS